MSAVRALGLTQRDLKPLDPRITVGTAKGDGQLSLEGQIPKGLIYLRFGQSKQWFSISAWVSKDLHEDINIGTSFFHANNLSQTFTRVGSSLKNAGGQVLCNLSKKVQGFREGDVTAELPGSPFNETVTVATIEFTEASVGAAKGVVDRVPLLHQGERELPSQQIIEMKMHLPEGVKWGNEVLAEMIDETAEWGLGSRTGCI